MITSISMYKKDIEDDQEVKQFIMDYFYDKTSSLYCGSNINDEHCKLLNFTNKFKYDYLSEVHDLLISKNIYHKIRVNEV